MLSFKLKFQTSQITHLPALDISEKIIKKLKDKKYEIEEVSDQNIIFGRPLFELVWNFEAPYILDGGDFEITKSEKGTTIILNYFIKTFYPILIFTLLMTFMLIREEYFGLLFFAIFFLITGTIQFFTTQNVGKELLKDIIEN